MAVQDLEEAATELLAALGPLDSHLQRSTFVGGSSVCLADVALAVDLRQAFEKVLTPLPHLTQLDKESWSMPSP